MIKQILLSIFFIGLSNIANSQSPDWYYLRPDNTGIGGDYIQAIRSDISESKRIECSVVDLVGKKIKSIQSDYLQAGHNSYILDLN